MQYFGVSICKRVAVAPAVSYSVKHTPAAYTTEEGLLRRIQLFYCTLPIHNQSVSVLDPRVYPRGLMLERVLYAAH